jgi:hypothetical protein
MPEKSTKLAPEALSISAAFKGMCLSAQQTASALSARKESGRPRAPAQVLVDK